MNTAKKILNAIPEPLRELPDVKSYIDRITTEATLAAETKRKGLIAGVKAAENQVVNQLPSLDAEIADAEKDISKANHALIAGADRLRKARHARDNAKFRVGYTKQQAKRELEETAPTVIAERISAWEKEILDIRLDPPWVKDTAPVGAFNIKTHRREDVIVSNNDSINARLVALRAAITVARELPYEVVTEAEAVSKLDALYAGVPAIQKRVVVPQVLSKEVVGK